MPTYRSASGSSAEGLFIERFSGTFGVEKGGCGNQAFEGRGGVYMSKQGNILTAEGLAVLGILDETLDLYNDLCNTVLEAYATAQRDAHPHAVIWPDRFDKLCKTPINHWIKKHLSIFTEDFHHLYSNNRIFHGFSMLDTRRTDILQLEWRPISFSKFMDSLGELIVRAISYRTYSGNIYARYDHIRGRVRAHVSKKIAEKRAQSSVPANDAEIIKAVVENAVDVWVYRNTRTILCVSGNHEIAPRTVRVLNLASDCVVNLPVRYCATCKRYFISDQTLSAYESEFGKLLIRTSRETADKAMSANFQAESELHRWGYNVIDGQTTAAERQKLIRILIQYGLMDQEAICRDLENALGIFEKNPKMQLAVQKWKRDLVFCRNLSVNESIVTGRLLEYPSKGAAQKITR